MTQTDIPQLYRTCSLSWLFLCMYVRANIQYVSLLLIRTHTSTPTHWTFEPRTNNTPSPFVNYWLTSQFINTAIKPFQCLHFCFIFSFFFLRIILNLFMFISHVSWRSWYSSQCSGSYSMIGMNSNTKICHQRGNNEWAHRNVAVEIFAHLNLFGNSMPTRVFVWICECVNLCR